MVDDNTNYNLVTHASTAGTGTTNAVNTKSDIMFYEDPRWYSDDVDNQLFIQGMATARFDNLCGRKGVATANTDGFSTRSATLVACDKDDFPTVAALTEYGERYAYVGKGPDRLYLDPQPDAMVGAGAVITYIGPPGGCTVTEVTKGSTEAHECSGRGNCDYETGTCNCDEGYTLESCSEQTVLV